MTLITTDDSAFPLNENLNDIRDQLGALKAEMAAMQARVKDGDIEAVKDGQKTIQEIRHWLRIAIDLEMEFAKRQQNRQGSSHPMPLISTRPGIVSGAGWIACAPVEVQAEFLDDLSEGELMALPYLFEFWAMEHQLPPEGDWRAWVIMGGRGAGKTRAGAEWVRSMPFGVTSLLERYRTVRVFAGRAS